MAYFLHLACNQFSLSMLNVAKVSTGTEKLREVETICENKSGFIIGNVVALVQSTVSPLFGEENTLHSMVCLQYHCHTHHVSAEP